MRLSEVDDSNRGDHARLEAGDTCYYLFEYTSGRDYTFSTTNNLISNLKKPPTASAAQRRYKAGAIAKCANDLKSALNEEWLKVATVVPIPGSKAADHPDFDNRMERVGRLIHPQLSVRNLVLQSQTTISAHEAAAAGARRLSVDELVQLYRIDENQTDPPPTTIGVLDDVLTAGAHFRAMKIVLNRRFPGVPIVGLFVARRVFPPEQLAFEDVERGF